MATPKTTPTGGGQPQPVEIANQDGVGSQDGVMAADGGDRDEFAVIERLRARFAPGAAAILGPNDKGIGDDAALVTPGALPVVAATDLVVSGVHVDERLCSPADMGWKAVMVTVSDLAAMGAWPEHLLLSVAAPAGFDLDELSVGVAEAAQATRSAVVGGDLSASPVLVVAVTALGSLSEGANGALRRDGARPGDTLMVTGPTGGSALGLRMARSGQLDHPAVLSYRRPVARLLEGRAAREAGATAAIDLSDGLAGDVLHLADASGVGVVLELPDDLGVPDATAQEVLSGGEEYELVLATADPEGLERTFAAAGLRRPLVIGRCTADPSHRLVNGAPLEPLGWRHRF